MSAVPAWADTTGSTDSIWINFASGRGSGAASYTGTWNDTTGNTGSNFALNYSDNTSSGALLTYNAGGTYEYITNVDDGVLKGYLDDGSTTITVSVSGISYLFYDVTVLVASDSQNRSFTAKTLNGNTYTSDGDGNGILGGDSWGATRQTSINNNNSFTVSGLYGDLSLSSTGDWTGPRGSVAGLIITNTSADAAVNATVSADSTWTSDSLAETAWTNATSETQTHSYANLTLSNSATLDVTGTGITTNAIIATADAAGDAKMLTLSGNEVSLIGPSVVQTDSDTASIVINNTLNFSEGGKISGNVSTGTGGLLQVSAGTLKVAASESASLNVSVADGVSLGISSGTVNITEGTNTITTANLSGGAISGGNITTANVTGGTVAISGSTIGTLNATGGIVNFSGAGTTTTISGQISVSGGATVAQSAGTVSADRLVLNDSNANTASFYTVSDGVLNITGTKKQTSDATSDNAILIGHWNSGNNNNDASILKVSGGVLNATSGITTISWDSAGTLEISGGEANLYGITLNKYRNKGASTFTLSGGRVNLGAGGLTYGNGSAAITSKTAMLSGGTLGALEDWSSSVAISVAGNVAIDTTKRTTSESGVSSEATGDSSGAAITLSGGLTFSGDDSALEISGKGSVTLGGTVSGATVGTAAKITVNSGSALTLDASSLIYALTGDGDSVDGKTLNIATGDGTISTTGTLSRTNFTWNGFALSERTEVSALSNGSVAFSGGAYNLFWKGGDSWDTSSADVWVKDSAEGASTAFVAGDNVTFSAGQDVSVTFSDNLTAGKVSIAGNVTLADSDSFTGTLTGKIVVADGGTLNVNKGASNATSGASAIRGSLTIQSGGKVSFSIKDVCGWSDTASSRLDALTVDSGGTLEINQKNNETFRGTLTLNGTLTRGTSGGDSTAWDLHGGSAKIVTTVAGAKIDSGVNLRLRQNNSEINVGSGASLEIASIISYPYSNEGNGLLRKTGTGTLTLSGANTYSGGTNIEVGTVVAKNASALGTGTVSVASGAKLGLVANVTVADVTGGITLAEGAKIVVDMTDVTSPAEEFTLNLITGTALTYGETSITSANVGSLLGAIELSSNWTNADEWVKSLSFADDTKTLTLTLTIPEPSAFGLLAGVGALMLVAARRRRRTK